jgi:hypothetical protein
MTVDPKRRLGLVLSPAALAVALAIAAAHTALPVPWFAVSVAHASHCAPPCACDCVCVCDCVCACDCACVCDCVTTCDCHCYCDCAGCDF